MLAVCWLLTGSLWASALMLAAIALVLLDMGGAMYLAGIQLNAARAHLILSSMCVDALQQFFTRRACAPHAFVLQTMAGVLLRTGLPAHVSTGTV